VIMLSVLVIFTFSLLGMNLFGDIKEGENAINKDANFNTLYNSMCLLWVCATGEGWNMVMYDTIAVNGWWVVIFWISFVILMVFIFLNVIVAVIFEKLEEQAKMMRHENSFDGVEALVPLIQHLLEKWQLFDVDGTGFIPTKELLNYLSVLKAPLGFN
jgi:hypothetical protein